MVSFESVAIDSTRKDTCLSARHFDPLPFHARLIISTKPCQCTGRGRAVHEVLFIVMLLFFEHFYQVLGMITLC